MGKAWGPLVIPILDNRRGFPGLLPGLLLAVAVPLPPRASLPLSGGGMGTPPKQPSRPL